MPVTVFGAVIGILIFIFLILAWFFERAAKDRATKDTEEKAMLLLYKVERLIEERKDKKALKLLSKYTSHKVRISDIIPLIGTQID
jgi:hypothetical protein